MGRLDPPWGTGHRLRHRGGHGGGSARSAYGRSHAGRPDLACHGLSARCGSGPAPRRFLNFL
eukprot:10486495-Alexandrium_andersonii.AAC.1